MRTSPATDRLKSSRAPQHEPSIPPVPFICEAATTVRCLSQYDWMNNVKNQSPCLIASWSVVPCKENSWIIPAISSAPYTGPLPGSALFQCQCNTVHYSLVAACGACQGFHGDEGAVNWTSFRVNCPPDTIQGAMYSLDVPPETAFPPWAYLDLKDDQWDETAASARALQDISAGTSSSLSSSSLSASPVSTIFVTATTSDVDNADRPQSTNIIGVAVGGAVGGVALFLLAGIFVLLCLRHRRARSAALARAQPTRGPRTSADEDYYGHFPKATLYDPDDPSTFPPSFSTSSRPVEITSDDESGASGGGPNMPSDAGRVVAEIQ
ncbi:hypothetical protein C8Q76DRAFT_425626 [Earliella scabrosa]|nr:hypothetical protein C8Q76DRAFT_425626 [Earliella scabrosa]